jgi:chemosensory pili system protein ChpC
MSQAPVAGSAPPTLNCLLLPLTDRTLLLPSVALAELINQRPVEPRPGMPDWYLGEIVWRGLRLPLLSFETASSGTLPAAPASGARVAVINAIGGRPHLKFFALLVQGIPRPCKLDAALAAAGAPLAALELGSAVAGGEAARIPDLVGLEQRMADTGLI